MMRKAAAISCLPRYVSRTEVKSGLRAHKTSWKKGQDQNYRLGYAVFNPWPNTDNGLFHRRPGRRHCNPFPSPAFLGVK